MNKIGTIIKKELKRFFTDKRFLVSLFLPGILIYVIYSLMGTFLISSLLPSDDYTYNVIVENCPTEYQNYFVSNEQVKINLIEKTIDNDTIMDQITNSELDLYVYFDEDFISKKEHNETPNVSLYYNSTSSNSYMVYEYFYSLFASDGTNITYLYHVNNDPNIKYDLAKEEDLVTDLFSSILPFILLIFLFTGCLAIATESIAGEKERGTIATLLVTPTKRSYIAIGKILALSITSLASAACSSICLILALPKLMSADDLNINFNIYGFKEFFFIFIIIALAVILFTTILSIVSAMAKTIKEASQWSSMIMVIVMLVGMLSFIDVGESNIIVNLIPLYNIVHCISNIFAMKFNALGFILTTISTIGYIALGVFILTKMFNSEKIMSHN